MLFHNIGQSLIQVLVIVLPSIHQFFQPRHQNLQSDVIKNDPSVHEGATDYDQSTAETRVFQHYLTILLISHVLPIVFDQFHAFAYIVLPNNEDAVLHHGHQEETERAAEFQLLVKVLDLEDDVYTARDQNESEQFVAEEI